MSACGALSTPSVARTRTTEEGGPPVDTPRTTSRTTADRRWFGSGRSRTIAAVVVTVLVCSAASAGAAALITGPDVKNGSLTGEDIKKGSVPKGDLEKGVQNAL